MPLDISTGNRRENLVRALSGVLGAQGGMGPCIGSKTVEAAGAEGYTCRMISDV